MCKSIMKTLGKIDPAQKLMDKTDAADPLMKSLGYEGIWNPANELTHKLQGTQSKVTEKRLKNAGPIADAQQEANYRSLVDGSASGHVRSIAKAKAMGR